MKKLLITFLLSLPKMYLNHEYLLIRQTDVKLYQELENYYKHNTSGWLNSLIL